MAAGYRSCSSECSMPCGSADFRGGVSLRGRADPHPPPELSPSIPKPRELSASVGQLGFVCPCKSSLSVEAAFPVGWARPAGGSGLLGISDLA